MITFVRKTDGTFERTGELAPGTTRVRIDIDGTPGLCSSRRPAEAVELVEAAIASGKVRGNTYTVVEQAVRSEEEQAARKDRMAAAREARLGKLAEAKQNGTALEQTWNGETPPQVESVPAEEVERLYAMLPENGQAVGNVKLERAFGPNYQAAKHALLTAGRIALGRGRGGSIRRKLK